MKTLIVVDVQNDFCPGGALAVPDGDQVIPVINKLLPKFDLVIFTKDWHNPNMEAFASSHPGKEPFEKYTNSEGVEDTLWPDHCVANTLGAMLHADIAWRKIPGAFYIFKKGTEAGYHPYSGFGGTDLADFLKERGVDTVYVTGLATDFCCKDTALDAVNEGFETIFVLDGTRAISEEGKANAIKEMLEAGVHIVESWELPLFNLM